MNDIIAWLEAESAPHLEIDWEEDAYAAHEGLVYYYAAAVLRCDGTPVATPAVCSRPMFQVLPDQEVNVEALRSQIGCQCQDLTRTFDCGVRHA